MSACLWRRGRAKVVHKVHMVSQDADLRSTLSTLERLTDQTGDSQYLRNLLHMWKRQTTR